MQTWKIKGQVYTHAQLLELRKQGLDPRKDHIEMKFVTKNSKDEIVGEVTEKKKVVASEPASTPEAPAAPEQAQIKAETEEYARLKKERAWTNPAKKPRYDELKAKFK